MKFEDKIANSTIIKEGLLKKKSKIKSKRERIIGIIITSLTIAYLIFSNVLKFYKVDKSSFFDSDVTTDEIILYSSFIAVILKIVFSAIMAFLKKSIYALNHYKLYNIIDILSNIDLFAIFSINIYNYYTLLNSYNVWDSSVDIWNNIKNLFFQDPKSMLLLGVTIVTNLPVVFKFIKFSFTNGLAIYGSLILVVLSPIFWLKYMFTNNRVFFEYADKDEEHYIMRKRYIESSGYAWSCFLKKLLVSFILLTICSGYMFAILLFSNNLTNMNLLPVCIILTVFLTGFFTNCLYFIGVLQEGQLDKREAQIIKVVKE